MTTQIAFYEPLAGLSELTLAEIDEVSGSGIVQDAYEGFTYGGAFGSVLGAVVTGTTIGATRGGLIGGALGMAGGLGWGIGSWLYKHL